jgi:hypothetical protein
MSNSKHIVFLKCIYIVIALGLVISNLDFNE